MEFALDIALEGIDRVCLDDSFDGVDPGSQRLARELQDLAPDESRTLNTGVTVTRRSDDGFIIIWPGEEPFRANEAEGAATDALAYTALSEGDEPLSEEQRLQERKRLFEIACTMRRDVWLAANGGSEQPTRHRDGRVLLYCFNPKQGRHAYLDVERDLIVDDAA